MTAEIKNKDDLPKTLDIDEACAFLKCSVRTLDEEVSRGNISAYKVGKKRVFFADDLVKLIKKKRVS